MTFAEFFFVIHGNPPFPWQQMLADREEWPEAIDLPTASGKTACLDAAIYRLATGKTMPRRIWFIVDRRIVVDEAHERALKIACALRDNPELASIAQALLAFGDDDCPLESPMAVARLRGGAWRDDSGWSRDPRQPAIICSTVDQLGSSLLFRPYGHGTNTASIYAGLAANDSLIILDEAHCSEPFRQTLSAIKRFRKAPWCSAPIDTPFGFTIMSATLPANDDDSAASADVFPADDEERTRALDNEKLHFRTRAVKTAALRMVGNKAEKSDPLVEAAAEQAKHYQQTGRQRIAIMVNRVNTAKEIHAKLATHDPAEVVLLTGRLRPLDRDAIVGKYSPRLRSGSTAALDEPIIIVTTQCLEVGADFSFDALVTECASLDALRQRFGRLDRLGELKATDATILIRDADTKVPEDKDDDPIYGKAIANTWAWLTEISTGVAPPTEPVTKKKAKKAAADAASRSVDFGINNLGAHVDALRESNADRFKSLLAPRPDAPILLPAHLDLLCQTSPVPAINPDVSLFLHGKGKHAPEVRVVFRLGFDLNDKEQVEESLRLLPPTSPECLSVPLYRLRQWLADHAAKDNSGDVEGETSDEDGQHPASSCEASRRFIIWKSDGDAKIASRPDDIKPNATIVFSAEEATLRDALADLGQATDCDTLRVDLAEEAQQMAKGRVVLRINEANFAALQLGDLAATLRHLVEEECEDRNEWKAAIADLRVAVSARSSEENCAVTDDWLGKALDCLSKGFRLFTIGDPIKEVVLIAKDRSPPSEDSGSELDDEMRSTDCGPTRKDAIQLANHTADVRRMARSFAKLLPAPWTDIMDRAAHAHDWGKLDPRFQVMLHGGDETSLDPQHPLAKSAAIHNKTRSPDLPPGWEHAMLSVQMAQHIGYSQDDTELHLIASHHGSARPFAAIVADAEAPAINLTYLAVGSINEEQRKALTPAHDLASNIANRFWQLVRKHGWWGEAYVEAVFRLADWEASRKPRTNEGETSPPDTPSTSKAASNRFELKLNGIDGANPLGMLAALGVVRTLTLAWPDRNVHLHWATNLGGYKAVISFDTDGLATDHRNAAVEAIAKHLRLGHAPDQANAERLKDSQKAFDAANKKIKDRIAAIKKRKLPPAQAKAARTAEVEPLKVEAAALRRPWLDELRLSVPSPEMALGKRVDVPPNEYRNICNQSIGSADPSYSLLSHFGTDAVVDDGRIKPTLFSFINGSGHQFFLETARELVSVVTLSKLDAALFELWQPQDEKYSMRWLPSEDRRYALMAVDPGGGSEKTLTVWAANLLGYAGLGLLPSAPTTKGLRTSGLCWTENGPSFTWPIWRAPLGTDAISSLIAASTENQLVFTRWRSFRIEVGDGANKKINFTPAQAI